VQRLMLDCNASAARGFRVAPGHTFAMNRDGGVGQRY
jgi:hypothetical protein